MTYGERVNSPFIEHVLSSGLQRLCQIVEAETYEERHRLLHSSQCPPATDYFLYEGLQCANKENNDITLDLRPEELACHMKRPFYADSDKGPATVWKWAHQTESWANWVYQKNRRDLRRWGYVMWDLSRLDELGIFQNEWKDTGRREDLLLEAQEAARQRSRMESSWKKREQIYMKGCTGWWSSEDHSMVRWRDGVKPDQGPSSPAIAEPISPEEAREMMTMVDLSPPR